MARPFQNVVYLRIRRGWLGIQTLTFTGRAGEWSGVPEAVFAKDLKGRDRVYMADDPALLSAMEHRTFRAFSHPRVVMDDFIHTGALVGVLFRRFGVRKAMVPWVCVLHVQDEWEGGLADIERRALVEMVREQKVRQVLLVTGAKDLDPPEVLRIARRRYVVADDGAPLALDATSG